MRINRHAPSPFVATNHNGGLCFTTSAADELKRAAMACLLWEDSFYEGGETIVDRISKLVPEVYPLTVLAIARDARLKMNLRHVPLLIAREMLKHPQHKLHVADLLAEVVCRPDELCEMLALYWQDQKPAERSPLAAQLKKGLAHAFQKFDAYQLAKWNNQEREIKLRDVMFLVHPKPKDVEQEQTFIRLAGNTLPSPDTWEVALSAGADKLSTWNRLLAEGKLGGLALLRNLRNMQQVGVPSGLIEMAIGDMKTDRILPYRFITAARYAPQFEPALEAAMFRAIEGLPKLAGKTVIMVDVSGSMRDAVSAKSEVTRMDTACGLAVLAREMCEYCAVLTFSDQLVEIAPRRGFALRDAIINSQLHSGTYLGRALQHVHAQGSQYDRLIVITDEQTADVVPSPRAKGYMLNVGSYSNGVSYGPWCRINGWSEAVLNYVSQIEQESRANTVKAA